MGADVADVLLTHSYHLFYDRKQTRKMQPYPPLGTLYAAIRHEQFEREEHERKQDALEEEHNVFRGKILEPAKWYSAERIAGGVVDRAKAAAAERGIDWTVPYQHEPYEPNADHWWS